MSMGCHCSFRARVHKVRGLSCGTQLHEYFIFIDGLDWGLSHLVGNLQSFIISSLMIRVEMHKRSNAKVDLLFLLKCSQMLSQLCYHFLST